MCFAPQQRAISPDGSAPAALASLLFDPPEPQNIDKTQCFTTFSRMRSKGSRFTLGVWGLRVCSLDVAFTIATVRNRPQPFATVRNRSQPFATIRNRSQPFATVRAIPVWPCLWEVLQRWSFLGVADVSLLRFAWQAWHLTCSGTCRKSFCVAGAILLWRCQKMCCSFRGRRSTLDVSIVIFRGDVSCCVFFDKVQIPWQAWHFVWCAENWRKPRTKHRFWGCKFSGSKENS